MFKLPELPEIIVLSEQMNNEISGKEIVEVEILQPKNLNIPVDEFMEKIVGRRIVSVKPRGKWLFTELSENFFLLINLGMGGDLLYFEPGGDLPEAFKFRMNFSDDSGFTINFWWFGYIHLVEKAKLKEHKMIGELELSPLDEAFNLEYFRTLLKGRRGRIKSFLLNQRRVSGIGNVYVQDVLFKARLHPNKKIDTMSDSEVKNLFDSMIEVLTKSVEQGGLAYEKDFYGDRGGFSGEEFLVGYKTGKPCPVCSTPIEKIRIGSTASYICPTCQKAN